MSICVWGGGQTNRSLRPAWATETPLQNQVVLDCFYLAHQLRPQTPGKQMQDFCYQDACLLAGLQNHWSSLNLEGPEESHTDSTAVGTLSWWLLSIIVTTVRGGMWWDWGRDARREGAAARLSSSGLIDVRTFLVAVCIPPCYKLGWAGPALTFICWVSLYWCAVSYSRCFT